MSILDGVQKVLTLFGTGATDLSFSEVAARLALPRSTASRLLNQMHAYQLLDQDAATRRYRPGALLSAAVNARAATTPLDDACCAALERMCEASGLTSYLCTLMGAESVVLQRINGAHPLQVLSQRGARRQASYTAVGRALLARLSEEEFLAAFGSDARAALPTTGRDTPGTVADLRERVQQAHASRYAVAIDESMPGVGAVAAAVRDPATQELRGLCLTFLSFQVNPSTVDALRALVLGEVGALGRQLGDPYWAT
ncbi:IclR family transcriptional regulator C-terminal domain-containing protein [Alcaligenaceae bacterium B3P038]|nr:IclR family transcriptional regulator C-terminal domain-containing protein [Alcaligenaceae bacterium B3P038]